MSASTFVCSCVWLFQSGRVGGYTCQSVLCKPIRNSSFQTIGKYTCRCFLSQAHTVSPNTSVIIRPPSNFPDCLVKMQNLSEISKVLESFVSDVHVCIFFILNNATIHKRRLWEGSPGTCPSNNLETPMLSSQFSPPIDLSWFPPIFLGSLR